MKIIPMRDIVAGDAQLRSWVSNRKLTLGPNCILSPDGMVRSRLSSRTELRDSIHSGSMSPSQIIHDWISVNNNKNNKYRILLLKRQCPHQVKTEYKQWHQSMHMTSALYISKMIIKLEWNVKHFRYFFLNSKAHTIELLRTIQKKCILFQGYQSTA